MELSVWMQFLVACIVISFSPGAGVVASMTAGYRNGVVRANWMVFGLQIGYMIYVIPVIVGVGAFVVSRVWLYETLRWFGIAYLTYLGLTQIFAKAGKFSETAMQEKETARTMIMRGFLINASNPKALIFMLAVLPQFIRPDRPPVRQTVDIMLTMLIVDIIVMNIYSVFAASILKLIRQESAKRWINRTFGALFILAALALALLN